MITRKEMKKKQEEIDTLRELRNMDAVQIGNLQMEDKRKQNLIVKYEKELSAYRRMSDGWAKAAHGMAQALEATHQAYLERY